MITQDRLKDLLLYSPDTGKFFWAGKPELTEAGWISNGYHVIRLDEIIYKAHHLAWLYYHGELPDMIDHRDHCKTNNAIMNLRKADFNINNFNREAHKNNKLGLKNISLRKNGKFQVSCRYKGEFFYAGCFSDLELAKEAARGLQNQVEEKIKAANIPVPV